MSDRINESAGQEQYMARRRFQSGTLRKREGKHKTVWVVQWREDVIENGTVVRKFIKESWPIDQFPTRKLALRELERRLANINSHSYRPTHRMLFGDFAQHWTDTVLPMHKPSSQSSERAHLARYIRPFFDKFYLHDITPMHVQRFVSGLRAAPKTVRNIYATFRAMWKLAKLQQLVHQNVCEGIRMPQLNPVERPAFTIEQMQQIIAAAEEPFKTFFWLAAETGMRIGELLGLRWEDVREGKVQVRQSVWNGQIGSPKSLAGTRGITISGALYHHLEGRRSHDGGLLFCTRSNRPWDARFVVRDTLHPLLQRLGIPKAGMHAFRHGSATHRLQAGEDVKTLATRLGHSDPSITLKVYAHAATGRDLSDKMGDILCKTNTKSGQPPSPGTKDVQTSFGTLGSELEQMKNAGVGWATKITTDAAITAMTGASN
jgi:integrase